MGRETARGMLKQLPSVDEIMGRPGVAALRGPLQHDYVVGLVRGAVEDERRRLVASLAEPGCAETGVAADGADAQAQAQAREGLCRRIERAVLGNAAQALSPSLRHVVNATGIVIHTNLGRSPLAPEAISAVVDVARGYSTLEYDVGRMARGSRHNHIEPLICALTGAEAAVVVNNNAAAVILVLTELAAGSRAIVSRGEQVEIGGSFRIPDIMAMSGAHMVEVGATNKTHLADYERALSDDVALMLKVHTSNYRMLGFTESVSVAQLRKLADEENGRRAAAGVELPVYVYEDQGSGALLRLDCFGDYEEPTVAESVAEGCDVVSFSGDKLLGGAQAGIVVGRKALIDRLKGNPLMRALRPDKLTLAALEATLRLYLNPEQAKSQVPTLRMLAEPVEDVQVRAAHLLALVEQSVGEHEALADVVQEVGHGGGGALPACDIETAAVRLSFVQGSPQDCERFLVGARDVPVVGRIKKDALLFDARTLLPGDAEEIAQALRAYFDGIGEAAGRPSAAGGVAAAKGGDAL